MQHREIDSGRFPPGVLYGAGAMIAAALLSTAAVRTGAISALPSASEARATANVAALETRSIRFVDRADGGVDVIDTADGSLAGRVVAGSLNGFVRGVMRGLARDRHLSHVGPEAPFVLTRYANGALTLDDPSTRRHIELGSFGPTNRAAFRIFLKSAPASQARRT